MVHGRDTKQRRRDRPRRCLTVSEWLYFQGLDGGAVAMAETLYTVTPRDNLPQREFVITQPVVDLKFLPPGGK